MRLVGQNVAARFARKFDPEDVVQSAFRSWFNQTRKGEFRFDGDLDVWKVLVTFTFNKMRNRVRSEQAVKRNVNNEVSGAFPFDEFISRRLAGAPGPVEQLEFEDLLNRLLEGLSPRGREIIRLRIEGHLCLEIAEQLDISEKTVTRTLKKVFEVLQQINDQEAD